MYSLPSTSSRDSGKDSVMRVGAIVGIAVVVFIGLVTLAFLVWLIAVGISDYNAIADCAERGGLPINYAPGVVTCR